MDSIRAWIVGLFVAGAVLFVAGLAVQNKSDSTSLTCTETNSLSSNLGLPTGDNCGGNSAGTVMMIVGGVIAGSAVVAAVVTAAKPERKVCEQCQQRSPAAAKLCGYCGTPFTESGVAPTSDRRS